YTHATSQPKNEPRPRLTHVYMPPADVIRLLNWLIEYAVNRHAMSANRTASGVMPPANVVANPIDRAAATAGAMNVIDWNRTSVRPTAPRWSWASGCAPAIASFPPSRQTVGTVLLCRNGAILCLGARGPGAKGGRLGLSFPALGP